MSSNCEKGENGCITVQNVLTELAVMKTDLKRNEKSISDIKVLLWKFGALISASVALISTVVNLITKG